MLACTPRSVLGFIICLASTSGAQPAPVRPNGPMLVVANQRKEAAHVIDVSSGRVVTSIELGIEPHEVAVSPNARTVAIAGLNAGFVRNRGLMLLDATTLQLRRIELGHRGPHGVTFISDSLLLVTAMFDRAALYVDLPSGRVTRVLGGLPQDPYVLHLARTTGRAYVSSPHSSVVTELDVGGARSLRAFAIADGPAGMNVSPDGAEVWAAVWRQEAGGAMTVVDIGKGSVVARLDGFQQPRRVAFIGGGARVVVTDRDHLRIVDRAGRRVIASVHLGQNAGGSGVACTPDSTRCYAALSQSGEIAEVDVVGFKVLRRFAAERGVDGIAFVPR